MKLDSEHPPDAEGIVDQLYTPYRRSHYYGSSDRLNEPHGAVDHQPTLPPEIATDAAIYVAAVLFCYAVIIVIILGSNLHRFQRNRTTGDYVQLSATTAVQDPQGATTLPADDASSWMDSAVQTTV
ncbi:unnamed protein product [Meganyctiphanes norvegica]|uniref:Uncharacterized protein n=1 Tax=Meganyctiphanes norvegica TaxID=48144 RepID=A0AAV2S7P5_MEGNR